MHVLQKPNFLFYNPYLIQDLYNHIHNLISKGGTILNNKLKSPNWFYLVELLRGCETLDLNHYSVSHT